MACKFRFLKGTLKTDMWWIRYCNRRHPAIQSWESGGRRLWEANLAVAQPQEVDFSEVRADVIERALGRIVWQGQLDSKSGNGGWLLVRYIAGCIARVFVRTRFEVEIREKGWIWKTFWRKTSQTELNGKTGHKRPSYQNLILFTFYPKFQYPQRS